jgi:6-phosphogluconolactonase
MQATSIKSRVDEPFAEASMRILLFRLLSVTLLVVFTTNCGQTGASSAANPAGPSADCTASTQPAFAYVLNGADATVSMYTINSCTGALTPATPSTIPTGVNNGFNAESMAVDPTGKFLYVANLGSNATDAATVSMFTIDRSSGVLTATSPGQVPTGFFPQGIAASANFVYTANSDDNSVSMFTINTATGLLTPLTPPETPVPPLYTSVSTVSSPDFVTVDPSGHFLYVTDQDNGSISSFIINSNTGALTPTNPPGTDAGVNPWKLIFHPSGKFAYVPDEGGNDVSMYGVDSATGVLTPNPAVDVPAGNQAAYMAVDPTGHFAYVVNRLDDTVSMFTIDPSTGTLIPNTPAVIETGSLPFSIAVDPSGTFVYVTDQGDSTVSIYRIGNDGTLAASGTANTGNDPVAIAVTP